MFTVAHWRMVSLIKLFKNRWPSHLTNIEFEASNIGIEFEASFQLLRLGKIQLSQRWRSVCSFGA